MLARLATCSPLANHMDKAMDVVTCLAAICEGRGFCLRLIAEPGLSIFEFKFL